MARRFQNKRKLIYVLVFLLGVFVPLLIAALGDVEIIGDLLFTATGKGIRLYTGDGYYVWLKAPDSEASYTIRLPESTDGATGTIMTISEDGETIAFMSTAAYDGDIQSVWTDTTGDVSVMKASEGDTLDATSADSTVPWKVATTGTPTTEGQALWDSDDNFLKVGDGSNTTAVGPPTYPPTSPTASGAVGQMAYDSKYVYAYVATNTWRRAALSTWTDEHLLLETGWRVLLENGDFILLE